MTIWSPVLTDGLATVEAACAEALAEGLLSADVIFTILDCSCDPPPAVTIMTIELLRCTMHLLPTAIFTTASG